MMPLKQVTTYRMFFFVSCFNLNFSSSPRTLSVVMVVDNRGISKISNTFLLYNIKFKLLDALEFDDQNVPGYNCKESPHTDQ